MKPEAETVVGTLRRGWRVTPELHDGVALSLGLAICGALGRLVVPVLLQQTIDRALRPGAVDVGLTVRLVSVAAVVTIATQLSARAGLIRLGSRAERALYGMRGRAFAHLHRLSGEQQAELRRGGLVGRVTSDVELLAEFLSWGAAAWLFDIPLMLGTAIVMFVYNPILAVGVIVVSAPVVFILRALQHRLVRDYGIARDRYSDVLAETGELVAAGAMLRAYDAQTWRTQRTVAASNDYRRASLRAGVWTALMFPTGEFFTALAIATTLWLGVRLGPASGLTTGTMVGFVFLAYKFLDPVAELTEVIDQTQLAVAGWRRVLSLLDIAADVPEPVAPIALPGGPQAFDVRKATVAYRPRSDDDENVPALRDVTVHIPAGQLVAVVGSTGSGKTTFARLLGRQIDPTSGTVVYGGVDLRSVASAALRRSVLVVPQEPFLFAGTIAHNIRFADRSASDETVAHAVTSLGLMPWIESLAEGLNTHVGERGDELSAGERQLVALARAAFTDPPCLVLDEATSSVDPVLESLTAEALEWLSAGRTTIVIAHRLSTAARADRVLVFNSGTLIEDGRHADLVVADGVYASLYASWLEAIGTV